MTATTGVSWKVMLRPSFEVDTISSVFRQSHKPSAFWQLNATSPLSWLNCPTPTEVIFKFLQFGKYMKIRRLQWGTICWGIQDGEDIEFVRFSQMCVVQHRHTEGEAAQCEEERLDVVLSVSPKFQNTVQSASTYEFWIHQALISQKTVNLPEDAKGLEFYSSLYISLHKPLSFADECLWETRFLQSGTLSQTVSSATTLALRNAMFTSIIQSPLAAVVHNSAPHSGTAWF